MTVTTIQQQYDTAARAIHWMGTPESRVANFDDLDPQLQDMIRNREHAEILDTFGEVDWDQVQSVLDAIAAQPETRQQYEERLSQMLRTWQRNPGWAKKIDGVTPATIDAARLAALNA